MKMKPKIQNSKFKLASFAETAVSATKAKQNLTPAFSLPEVLLSIAMIAIISGISTPVYQLFITRNNLDITATTIAQSLRRAQVLSQAVDDNISWGVSIQLGNIILFKGVNYASRDASFDEIFELPTNITPSGISEIVFAQFTGLPQTTGTTTLTSDTNEVRTIVVNSKGMIGY